MKKFDSNGGDEVASAIVKVYNSPQGYVASIKATSTSRDIEELLTLREGVEVAVVKVDNMIDKKLEELREEDGRDQDEF